jgi:YHS domain-containing protein
MRMLTLLMCLSLFSLLGCASTSPKVASASATSQPHAECMVCKYNADLACVDVTVDSKTPRCVCSGQTYYFCSEECKHAFEKNPTKYLSQRK